MDKSITPNEFKLKQVSNDFIFKELSNLNIHKGISLDELAPKFLKDGAPQLFRVMTFIVNLSISSETVPDDLKSAKVIPLYKKKSRLDVGNHRPVSILSCMSKILEKSVYIQIEQYLNSKDLIYPFQSGFRPGCSTETCLIYLTDLIRTQISKGILCGNAVA